MTGRHTDIVGEVEATLAAARAGKPGSALSGVLTALHQAPIGIAIFDRGMRYLSASAQFLTDQGMPGDTPLVGRLHYDVFPEIPQNWRDIHARVLRDGVDVSHPADPYVRDDGQVDYVRWSVSPWRTEEGAIGGLVLYTEVVTPTVAARLQLEAAEARYRAVFDQAAMGVARVAPDARYLQVNDRFCQIAQRSRAEILRLTAVDITHPDDLPADLAQTDALLSGEIESGGVEKRYLAPDGQVIWVHVTRSVVRNSRGEPDYFVAITEDITDRKQAEDEQQRYQGQLRLMINELNHRVKNTLATVQSMAAQTLRSEPDPLVAFEKLEARLVGLSQVHDVLTREHWHGADLQEVAERALLPFAGAASGRVSLHGPAVWLQPGAALTMALVFHELATNAVKYGALSVQAGHVDLEWSLDADRERLRLAWVESGGPPVTPPVRQGFGSRLIERGLTGGLGGSADMRYEPDGLTCALEMRLSRAGDAPGPFDWPDTAA